MMERIVDATWHFSQLKRCIMMNFFLPESRATRCAVPHKKCSRSLMGAVPYEAKMSPNHNSGPSTQSSIPHNSSSHSSRNTSFPPFLGIRRTHSSTVNSISPPAIRRLSREPPVLLIRRYPIFVSRHLSVTLGHSTSLAQKKAWSPRSPSLPLEVLAEHSKGAAPRLGSSENNFCW
jgi:hypothetical protein